jgi:hypothetical protein
LLAPAAAPEKKKKKKNKKKNKEAPSVQQNKVHHIPLRETLNKSL